MYLYGVFIEHLNTWMMSKNVLILLYLVTSREQYGVTVIHQIMDAGRFTTHHNKHYEWLQSTSVISLPTDKVIDYTMASEAICDKIKYRVYFPVKRPSDIIRV